MKPILFNTEMVKAILDGRKTVTRRLAKNIRNISEETQGDMEWEGLKTMYPSTESLLHKESHYQAGDILYVRETWCDPTPNHDMYPILYKADFPQYYSSEQTEWGGELTLTENEYKWRPSIHMPKEAARIFLRVTGVRVERLRDITVEGAKREGALSRCQYCNHLNDCCGELAYVALNCLYTVRETMRNEFQKLWDSTVDMKNHWMDQSWKANPWVWVIEFERCENPELLEGRE